FLLTSPTAQRLFHEVAAHQPILDYHTHLPPDEVHNNQRWSNLTDLWLSHDHYKWRAMRANGIPESHITGNASEREKFDAWAATIPHTLRNPLYDWTHLELRRAFNIDLLLSPETADEIWHQANERLADPTFSAQGLLSKFNVTAVGTTDDAVDSLEHHTAHNSSHHPTKLYPTFRPDKALFVDRPHLFKPWLTSLEEATNSSITNTNNLLSALQSRHDFFHQNACRLSDHGLSRVDSDLATLADCDRILTNTLNGQAATPAETQAFSMQFMSQFGRWNSEKNWTMQLHLNPLRNPKSRDFRTLGPDRGFDSIADFPQRALPAFLDVLDSKNHLPKTILYTLNPKDNAFFASIAGAFCESPTPGKVQFGAAWWYNDTKFGIQQHLETISSIGLLSRFLGFLTDSRSFLSYPRHEYFRRILCNLIGNEVDSGQIPNDSSLLNPLIKNLCYDNARSFLNLPTPASESPA
ncbi:MAG: glucuronate isomerase, partial [Verrucomicrobiota bacterium]